MACNGVGAVGGSTEGLLIGTIIGLVLSGSVKGLEVTIGLGLEISPADGGVFIEVLI